MIETMKQRRSIRKYEGKEIPEELLNELLTVAARASNTGNMQLYSVIVTRDAAQKEKLSPAHFNQPMIREAPVVLTVCADTNRFDKWAACRKAVAGFDNYESFTAAFIDAVIFGEAFAEAAEERGLGICYLGTTTYNAQPIIDALALPKRVVPVVTITVGYPAENPEPSERLPLEAFVHQETYYDYTPQRIDALYREKEQLPVNRQFVEENGKESLAQVFTDIRYTKENNEYFSKLFMEVVRKQGFME